MEVLLEARYLIIDQLYNEFSIIKPVNVIIIQTINNICKKVSNEHKKLSNFRQLQILLTSCDNYDINWLCY